MSTPRQNCDKDYPHVSHEWGIEFGDMGVAWYECDGRPNHANGSPDV